MAEKADNPDSIDAARPISPALIIFAVAFAARAVFLLQSLTSPYFGVPFLDEKYFFDWAARISQGQLSYGEAFFRAPLYAYLLGALFALTGPNVFVPKLLQHLLGSLAAVLVFKVTDRAFDRPTAWLAGVLAALYPPMIFFEGEILDISLQCFFYPALILIGIRSLRDPRWRWTVLFGLTAGAATIARPNVLLLIGGWLVLQVALASPWGGRPKVLAHAAVIVAWIVAWTLPPLIHNIRADGSWVLSTYAGVNLYIGNRLTADGYTSSTPRRYEVFDRYRDSVEVFARRKAEIAERRPLNGRGIQRFWTRRTWEEITADPGRFAARLAKKLVLFWNGYEIRNNKDLYFALQFTPLLDALHRVWNFRVLAPLGLLGIVLVVLRRPSVEVLWLGAGVLAHMVSVVMFFVCDRYRLPVAPLLIVFAAASLTTLWRMAAERQLRPTAIGLLGLAALAVFVNVPWYDMSPTIPHKDVWNVANCYKEKGQIDEALKWYQRFVALNPGFSEGWNNLGEIFVHQKELKQALVCFERAAQCDREGHMSVPWNNVGFCRLQLGDPDGALAAYDEAIRRETNNRIARNGRAEALAALNRHDEALAELDALLQQDPNFVLALWSKAKILAAQGDSAAARDLLRRALDVADPATAAEIRSDPALKKSMLNAE